MPRGSPHREQSSGADGGGSVAEARESPRPNHMPDHSIELDEARESPQRTGEARELPRTRDMTDHGILLEHQKYKIDEARESPQRAGEARESPPPTAEARELPRCSAEPSDLSLCRAEARESPPLIEETWKIVTWNVAKQPTQRVLDMAPRCDILCLQELSPGKGVTAHASRGVAMAYVEWRFEAHCGP